MGCIFINYEILILDNMIKATSVGAIVFRTTRNKIEYLVLKGRTGDWEFPKGGVEEGEEYQQTAIREIEEEAGITDLKLLPGFKKSYGYKFYSNGEKIDKTVHLFICHSFQASIDLSKEHTDHQWRTYEQARNTLTHNAVKEILDEAHKYIKKNIVNI